MKVTTRVVGVFKTLAISLVLISFFLVAQSQSETN